MKKLKYNFKPYWSDKEITVEQSVDEQTGQLKIRTSFTVENLDTKVSDQFGVTEILRDLNTHPDPENPKKT